MQRKIFISILIIFCAFSSTKAQLPLIPISEQGIKLPLINRVFNRITNDNLNVFYQKLRQLQKTKSGVVRIIHIGDSHIQADFLSGEVRKNLQKSFGYAGRGLVFPFQLAKSNAPLDIQSNSTTNWQFNRLAHPEIPINPGISGFCIQTNRATAAINFTLKADEYFSQSFKIIKLFSDNDSASIWKLTTPDKDTVYQIINTPADSGLFHTITLKTPFNQFSLIKGNVTAQQSFYGVSLENDQSGIIYHTIGVNGARFDHYNNTPLFWKQLPALQADLYIISLGTNEAQREYLDELSFIKELNTFFNNIKRVSPNAGIIVTTAADSYKGNGSNKILKQLNFSLVRYCNDKIISLWDLFKITNGSGAAKKWLKAGLLNKDKIHFTPPGYRIQGQLLYNAIISGYNNFLLHNRE